MILTGGTCRTITPRGTSRTSCTRSSSSRPQPNTTPKRWYEIVSICRYIYLILIIYLTAQDDRALTAKAVAHLCGLFSRDAWHSEHVSHSDLASIVKSFGAFIFISVRAIGMTSRFVYSRRAESSRGRTLRRFHESREKGTSGARQTRGVPRRQVRTNDPIG